jgi:purine-nucleoside phosphorylase
MNKKLFGGLDKIEATGIESLRKLGITKFLVAFRPELPYLDELVKQERLHYFRWSEEHTTPTEKTNFQQWGYIDTNKENTKLGVIRFNGSGSPNLAIKIEQAIASGGESFIIVGSAGSLNEDLPVGSFVVPTGALRGEGTSKLYDSSSEIIYPDNQLGEKIISTCLKKNTGITKIFSGITYTSDNLYHPTMIDLQEAKQKMAICVEMESSALFAIAQYYKKRAAALFYISESLENLNAIGHGNKIEYQKPCFENIIEVLASLG